MEKKGGTGIVRVLVSVVCLLAGFYMFYMFYESMSAIEEGEKQVNTEPLTKTEIRQMYTDPSEFRGRIIEIGGKILDEPEFGTYEITFQIFADPEKFGMNTYVEYNGTDLEIEKGDYVKIRGTVKGKATGMNLLGGVVSAPKIAAETVEISTYKDVVSPTLYTLIPNETTQTQKGYSVTVDSVEIAEKETRVYIKVENQGSSNFSVVEHRSIIIQDGKQYEPTYNFNADYPKVQSGIAPGVTTEGVYLFDSIENASFRLVLNGGSEDWQENIDPFEFNFTAE